MKIDYAKAMNRECWLRHPVMGDPSFDTFEVLPAPVHVSRPPQEWTVNGSLFRDPKTGWWYCYTGLYRQGYAPSAEYCYFEINRSKDEGQSWENLGPGFEKGFRFEGMETPCDIAPDVDVQ